MYQSDADKLAEAFRNCTSIKSLCITLYIGSRVTNIIPIMESIAGLPKLEYIRLVMVAFNQTPFNQLGAGGMQDNLVSLLSMLQDSIRKWALPKLQALDSIMQRIRCGSFKHRLALLVLR